MKNITRRAFLTGAAATLATPTMSQQITENNILNETALGINDYIQSNPVANQAFLRLQASGTQSRNYDVRTQSEYFLRFINAVRSGQFQSLKLSSKRQHLHCALNVLKTNLLGLRMATQIPNNTRYSYNAVDYVYTETVRFHDNFYRNFPPRTQQCNYPRL